MLQIANYSPDEVKNMEDSHLLAPLVDALQENLTAYCRMFTGLPGVIWQERAEALLFVSPSGPPGIEVLRTRFDTARVDAQIDTLLGQVAEHTDHFDWALYRTCRPDNLGQHLENRGLTPGSVTWLLADLDDVPAVDPLGDAFQIKIVSDAQQMEEWWHVSAAGFEGDDAQIKIFYDAYVRYPLSADADCGHYIGYWNGEPVTSASLLLTDNIAGLYNISTPPQFRRRGFGTAVTHATLQTARQRGYRHACCMASRMGKPIYQRLGFRVQINVPEYQWKTS